jgi:hypothetical protein
MCLGIGQTTFTAREQSSFLVMLRTSVFSFTFCVRLPRHTRLLCETVPSRIIVKGIHCRLSYAVTVFPPKD